MAGRHSFAPVQMALDALVQGETLEDHLPRTLSELIAEIGAVDQSPDR